MSTSAQYHALVLHEVATSRLHAGMGMVALLGDLVGAFPKAWRKLLIVFANLEAHVTGSRTMVMKEFLRHTVVELSYSGCSRVPMASGLPEGGMLGPLFYPLLPRLLDKALAAAGAGIGVDIPSSRLLEFGALNALLDSSAHSLESLDVEASLRLHILLIADDQIIPASSLSQLRSAAAIATGWARMTAQEYHVDKPDKTAILLLGRAAQPEVYNMAPVMLAGSPIPCCVHRKWCGIEWDAWLSFIPFLEGRMSAARAAFLPICALVREGVVPLEEARSVMKSTVEGTLFFAGMFFFLAPRFQESLVALQLGFERSLMGVGPWVPDALIRAAAGWALDWGERAVYETLAFRAELWCTREGMLVNSVWFMAQHMSGRTFAAESYRLLRQLGLPDITCFEGWELFVVDRVPVLPAYKAMLRSRLELLSRTKWQVSLQAVPSVGAHQLAQRFPCSAGFRLLEEGRLSVLHEAASFDSLRIGAVALSLAIPSGRGRRCILCYGVEHGLSHILAQCSACQAPRQVLLKDLDPSMASSLGMAPAGDWPRCLLSPHLPVEQLVCVVKFAHSLVELLKQQSGQ